MVTQTRNNRRILRHARVRAKMVGNAQRPRLSVFRSNKHLYVQLIDDEKSQTIAAVSDMKIKPKKKGAELIKEMAKAIAEAAKSKKIEKIVFDRGGYKYHGRVKVLAEELRAQGIIF